ncbi:DMT family transporter [Neobacillus massiliamazoniensis]|uniref:Membrane protein n=1 Tax=Neobacillus massiliamazoniensis TaxID=1499688 RepID=A0A0U1NWD3_9BACI|nr:DMT family transporter [Neobacillus massiliamazoniensis]CRK82062.1 membrane protein [Neobacillus massiliamazoniensis]
MILGLLLALFAGALVGLQNIFNSKVNEQSGFYATTTLVLGLGFLASLTFGLIFEGTHLFNLQNMKTWYWFSGLLGVGVVICLVQGIKLLGPTYAISLALTTQLVVALLSDSTGLMGLEKVPFTPKQLIGVLVIVGGIFVFKFVGGNEKQQVSSKVS